jgi:hypothetical protein
MQRRYPGRQTERRGPSNWQERNERAFWGAGEHDAPNYDESLLPDDEYDSSYRPGGEGSGGYGSQVGYGRAPGSGGDPRRHGGGRSSGGGQDASRGPGAERGEFRYRQGPKGYTRSDERIREDVCERLAGAFDIDVSDVGVQVRDGRVELDGSVPERWMKHGVEDIADGCMGVRDVENRVRVRRDDESGTGQVLHQDQRTVTPTPPAVREEADKPDSDERRH